MIQTKGAIIQLSMIPNKKYSFKKCLEGWDRWELNILGEGILTGNQMTSVFNDGSVILTSADKKWHQYWASKMPTFLLRNNNVIYCITLYLLKKMILVVTVLVSSYRRHCNLFKWNADDIADVIMTLCMWHNDASLPSSERNWLWH